MKIKEMLQALLSSEDFSDHSTGKEDGNGPLHDKGCTFCDAWRGALWLLSPEAPNLSEFEPGDAVELPGGVKGRVIATDFTIRVEVQGPVTHGPYATGSFRPRDLKPWISTEFSWWRDRDGAIWQRHEKTKRALMIREEDGTMPFKAAELLDKPAEYPRPFDGVKKNWGPLTRVDKP